MEHPDRTAVAELYSTNMLNSASRDALYLEPALIPYPRSRNWIIRLYRYVFAESNFAEAVDLKPARDQRIKLMKIAVDGATRLNGRSFSMRHGSALDLDEDQIVTVICETVRILMLEDKVRERLSAVRVSPIADR